MIVLLTESTYSYAPTQPISSLTHLPIYLSIRLDWIGMQTLYDREHSDGVFIYYGGGCSEDPGQPAGVRFQQRYWPYQLVMIHTSPSDDTYMT
jgi:hypothetical protein